MGAATPFVAVSAEACRAQCGARLLAKTYLLAWHMVHHHAGCEWEERTRTCGVTKVCVNPLQRLPQAGKTSYAARCGSVSKPSYYTLVPSTPIPTSTPTTATPT